MKGPAFGEQRTSPSGAMWIMRSNVRRAASHPLAAGFLIATLGALIYSNSLFVPFLFDDVPNIANSGPIKDFSGLWDISLRRYVGWLSFAINYHFGGLNVFGYHVVNVLIHIANGLLVYAFVALVLRTPRLEPPTVLPPQAATEHAASWRPWVASTTALLFVAHPVQTQAVTYVVQRFTSLAALFYLVALVSYLQWRLTAPGYRRRYAWYAGALAATILAMKTKEISFTLPIMLVLVEVVCFERVSAKRWVSLGPFLLTLFIIPLSIWADPGETVTGMTRETTDISRPSYLVTQFRVIVTYLRLLLVPIHQNLDYAYPIYDSFFVWPVFVSFLVLLGLFVASVWLVCRAPRYRVVGFGLLWFFLALSVESSIIPIKDVIFEHRLYLPSVGFLLASSAVAVGNLGRPGTARVAVIGLVIAVFSVATYQRNRIWQDEATLWRDVVSKSPTKARPHNNLGAAYGKREQWQEAIAEYVTALELEPDYVEAHINLGVAYAAQGRSEEAFTEYTTAVRLNPEYFRVHVNLGVWYADHGRLDDAIREYAVALRLSPNDPSIHYNLGNAYLRGGRVDEALREYRIALQGDSELPDIHNNLGNAYVQQGKFEDAVGEYRIALGLNPENPDIHTNLGVAYARLGHLDAAIAEYREALRLDQNLPETHYNLGVAYARADRVDEAIEEYLVAVRLDPGLFKAHFNLGHAYRLRGQAGEARMHFESALQANPDFAPARHALETLGHE